MQPSLLPDLAHLPGTLSVFGIALLAIGLGALAGARRVESALVCGWGIAAFVTVLAGALLRVPLEPAMLLLGGAGLAGLGWATVSGARGKPVLDWSMAGRVLLLAIPLLVLTEGADTSGWDDFSHWLPNLAYLCRYGHFPTLAEPSASYHAGYPAALALPGYASWLLLRRPPESAALTWHLVLMLAAGASIGRIVQTRLVAATQTRAGTITRGATEAGMAHPLTAWAAASAGLLLAGLACPTFVPKIFFSNMADASTASVVAVMGALLFQWWSEPSSTGRARVAFQFALCEAALLDLRQANAALFLLLVLGAGFGIFWQCRKWGVTAWRTAVIVLPIPLLTWALWSHYVAAEIPGGEMPVLPLAHWHWADFPSALANMGRVALAKTGLFAIIAAISVRAALALRRNDTLAPAQRGLLLAAVVVCLGNIAFLAFAYLAVGGFSTGEVAAAASFWRYASQTGPLATLAVVAVMPTAWARWCRSRAAAALLLGLATVLPVATVKLYRPDLNSPVPVLRRIADSIDRQAAPGQPVELVDITGTGFAPLVVEYQITIGHAWPGIPTRPVSAVAQPHGIPANEVTRIPLGAPYIWLAEATPEAAELFHQPLRAGCSYLLERERQQFTVIGAWVLSARKGRPVEDGSSASTGNPCP